MSNDQLVFCPTCGRRNALFANSATCPDCGTVVQRNAQGSFGYTGETTNLADVPPPVIPPTYTPPGLPPPPAAIPPQPMPGVQTRSGCLPSIIVIGVIVLLLGLGYAGITFLASAPVVADRPNLPIIAPLATMEGLPPIQFPDIPIATDLNLHSVALALPRDGDGADLIAYSYNTDVVSSERDRYNLVYVEGDAQPTIRWTGPQLSDSAYQSLVVLHDDTIFLADQDQLYAVNIANGSVIWQRALPVEPSCKTCLQAIDERVIVFQKDGTLQAFNAADGEPAWDMRLKSSPDALPVVDGLLLTLRDRDDDSGGVQIALLDPESGQSVRTLAPACTQEGTSFNQPLRYSWQILPIPGSDSVVISYTSGGCIDRWNLRSGEREWRVNDEDGLFPFNWIGETYLMTEDLLVFSTGDTVVRLDLQDGALAQLYTDEEYTLVPIGVADEMLIVSAAPEWDSQRFALWGLDAQGERRWEFAIDGEDRLENSSGDWEAHVARTGVVVIQALQDPNRVQIDVLDPDTGTAELQEQTDFPGSGSMTLYRPIWLDDALLIEVNGQSAMFMYDTGLMRFRTR